MAGKTRVAKYQADRTNQKLYFCRLSCQAAGSTNDKQLYQAHCETAIFHLYGSFLAFIQELGHFYSLNMTAPTLSDIEQALSERTQVSPEIQRLQQLQEQGFLANVERAYQRCLYAVLPDNSAAENANMVEIEPKDLIVNVVTLSNQWLPDEATIREWRQQLLELIEQLRAGMVEF
ncbi:MAG: hypothetical protein ACI9ST_001193 [Psychrobacter glaciei]|jgi:hypothetical protein|uniref:PasA protein n=1 Tax=Psychrobacter glaciei TaxID=619771 RepID=A0ABQ3GUY1_9GAMM|nr:MULTISPECIES: DUF6586 family protein [Psychrobacter]MBF4489258.1 hypothetical protein [Psychrobacter sp. N25K4-3-2]MBP3945678.1 hypothetical protein [Psychrobacter sp. K31L]GHD35510.1 hypothetical protein GCM10016272_21710 [Psychrobacter glaciei]